MMESPAVRMHVRPRYYRWFFGPGDEWLEINTGHARLDWHVPLDQAALVLVDVWWPDMNGLRSWNVAAEESLDARAISVLRSGRWILAAKERDLEQWSGKKYEPTRGEDGYDRGDAYSGFKGRIWFRVYYSDDEGKTWQGGGQPANHAPLVWANAPHGSSS